MRMKDRSVVAWPLVAGYLGIVIALIACGAGAGAIPESTAVPTEAGSLRLEDGAVQVQLSDKEWVPVAGESTFELVGRLEGTDPWRVTGSTFVTRDTTRIAEGLKVGDLVRVRGIILEDQTWLANSIEPAEEQTDPTILLIGRVTSIDPWVVHGITLNVTADTVIRGEIAPDMIVIVEILLREDGTWEVLSIAPLGIFAEIPGCVTVAATVAVVNGNEVHFTDWPAIQLGEDVKVENEDGTEGMLEADQGVLVVICATEDGRFVITKIVVLKLSDDGANAEGGKVLVCHKPVRRAGIHSALQPPLFLHIWHTGIKRVPAPDDSL
jgi:hypothetical protein